jgi:hypothetical protein
MDRKHSGNTAHVLKCKVRICSEISRIPKVLRALPGIILHVRIGGLNDFEGYAIPQRKKISIHYV